MSTLQPAVGKLGKALRQTRLVRGMSQMDVAREVGLDQTVISAIERGQGAKESREKVKEWVETPDDWGAQQERIERHLLQLAAKAPSRKRRLYVDLWEALTEEERDGPQQD